MEVNQSFSEGPRCDICKRTQITRAPRRMNPKKREDKIPHATNLGYNESRSQSFAPSMCGSNTRFGYSMDTELSVQEQDCTRYDEKCAAILTSKASLELFTLMFLVFTKSWQRSVVESRQISSTSFRNKWNRRKRGKNNNRRDFDFVSPTKIR